MAAWPFALDHRGACPCWGVSELYQAVRRQGGQPSEALGYFACILFQLFAWRYQLTAWSRGRASFTPARSPPTCRPC